MTAYIGEPLAWIGEISGEYGNVHVIFAMQPALYLWEVSVRVDKERKGRQASPDHPWGAVLRGSCADFLTEDLQRCCSVDSRSGAIF